MTDGHTDSGEDQPNSARGSLVKTPSGVALLLLLVFGLLACAIRMYRLNEWGLWIDEMYTIDHTVELFTTGLTFRPLGFMLHGIWLNLNGIDMTAIVPRQYEVWRALGVTPFHMRFPAMLVGVLSVPLLIWTLRRLLNRAELAIFACALSLCVWHIWMSQVARFYSLQFLLFALALVLYYRATTSGNFRLFCLCMITTTAAYFTQATSLMLIGIFGLDWLFVLLFEKRNLWQLKHWVAIAITTAVCLSWVFIFYWLNPSDFLQFYAGHQSFKTMLAGSVYLAGLPTVLLAAACSVMLWRSNPRWAFFLTSAWIAPIVAFALLRYLQHPVHVRYVFVALFPCLMLFSIGLARLFTVLRASLGLTFAISPVIALLGAMALQSYLYFDYGYGYRARWPEAVAFVANHRHKGERLAGAQGGAAMAKYYLGEPDVAQLDDVLRDHNAGRLAHPTWIIARVYEPSIGSREQRDVPGVLKAYYAN